MRMGIDELDQQILDRVGEHPGMHLRELVRPFFRNMSEAALRKRVERLELNGHLAFKKTASRIQVFLANEQ